MTISQQTTCNELAQREQFLARTRSRRINVAQQLLKQCDESPIKQRLTAANSKRAKRLAAVRTGKRPVVLRKPA